MHDIDEGAASMWGKRAEPSDVRALRRYNAMLLRMASAGEVSVYVLATLSIAVFVWFLYSGNFENIIFTDGTELTCVLNGSTGEMINGK